ncbi:hypothetical protein [Aliidiomarina minuta]|nr:hypothetical protein [Aliidiomarina minuta]
MNKVSYLMLLAVFFMVGCSQSDRESVSGIQDLTVFDDQIDNARGIRC